MYINRNYFSINIKWWYNINDHVKLNDEIDGVEFVKLDVDQHPQIAGQNQVMGVPTVVILKDGEVKDRFVGVQPKEVIKEKITSLG